MRARSTARPRDGARQDNALATALAAWAQIQRVVYHFTANQGEACAQRRLARKAKALRAMRQGSPCRATPHPAATTSSGELVIRRALSVDGGSGMGVEAATAGSTSTRARRIGQCGGSRSPLDLRQRFPLPSTPGSGSLAHSRPGHYLESAHWLGARARRASVATWISPDLCPRLCAGGASRAQRSCAACRNDIPGSRSQRGSKACRPCRQATAVGFRRAEYVGLKA